MRWLVVVSFTVALAPVGAWPQGQEQQASPSSDPHPGQQSDEKQRLKSYGYGEQPGTEARSEAKQSSQPGRAKSDTPQDERQDGTAAGSKERMVSGRVVSATQGSLSVRGEDRRVHRLSVTKETEVLRGGKRVRIGDVREGEEVRASFDVRGKRSVAKRITVGEEAARQPPAEAEKARGAPPRPK